MISEMKSIKLLGMDSSGLNGSLPQRYAYIKSLASGNLLKQRSSVGIIKYPEMRRLS